MRRTFLDKSAALFSIVGNDHADKRQWFDTKPHGYGLPTVPGVYRFRVPMEHDKDEKVEFLALLRWRRHGTKIILFPTFEYFLDDEFITIPEGTQWAYRESGDPQILAPDSFPIVQEIHEKVRPCPFCSKTPSLAGRKVCLTTHDSYNTSIPYRFNQFWFTCCEWIAPAPRQTINTLIRDWNRAIVEKNNFKV